MNRKCLSFKGFSRQAHQTTGKIQPPHYALEGSVLRGDEALRIEARLFDARTARDVWLAQLDADPADYSKILADLTAGFAGALDNELAP